MHEGNMRHKAIIFGGCLGATAISIFLCAALGVPSERQVDDQAANRQSSNVVTADIQAGIEKHIADQTAQSGGYYTVAYNENELLLKLVRVHTEYLANLGPGRHFACVDLVDTVGDVYDVDFFLAGDPGAMKVTETTVHKLNGVPFYAWQQNRDGVWGRIPIEEASQQLLGVITGEDEFEFLYSVKLPKITGPARMWLPWPASDEFQTVEVKSVSDIGSRRVLTDRNHGNKVLLVELTPADSLKRFDIRFQVKRIEMAAYKALEPDPQKHLKPERLVPADQNFQTIARGVTEGSTSDIMKARALYDHVMERVRYMKYGPGWGKGDAVYACNARTGNCTDFHSYFIALARAVDIPARFAIGAAIPSERNDGGIDGYHCWAEFYADGKWWPVDISEADKYSSLSTYYFGHHPANRFEFSRGRDLAVEPGPSSGPINFLAYPILEIAGKSASLQTTFSFNRPAVQNSEDMR